MKHRWLAMALLLPFCIGFRAYNFRWEITPEDPTIWVKFCATGEISSGFETFPESDPLHGITSATTEELAQTVFDDYNDIPTAYFRLAFYPNDPDNPGTPSPGDSAFTRDKAARRTIEICTGETIGAAAHALPSREGATVYRCRISMDPALLTSATSWISTFAHELGHCMGLDHPQDTIHSIMSYVRGDSSELRLAPDDKMGLTYLYPNEAASGDEISTWGLSCAPR